jgi:hypothetical protein
MNSTDMRYRKTSDTGPWSRRKKYLRSLIGPGPPRVKHGFYDPR